ncbi:membrane protein [Streptomyces phage BarryBee]|nr:membrane protein [Streptomyces phage BarryBee]
MSRADSGWEYGEWGVRWAPTTESAIAELTYDKYGQEYQEWRDSLMHIVRAAQRDAVEKLIEAGHEEAAALIFPDYPEED